MPTDIYQNIPLASMTHSTLQAAEQMKDMQKQLEILEDRLKTMTATKRRQEGAEAWEEGHDLLCKRKHCGHHNPFAE